MDATQYALQTILMDTLTHESNAVFVFSLSPSIVATLNFHYDMIFSPLIIIYYDLELTERNEK